MTIIELFAGIGTQFEAFKLYDTNMINIGISEIDPKPLKAYSVLHGTPNNFGDITKIEKLPYADIWTYSFPCTDLSIAGKQNGFSGEKSSLIYEVYRLLLVSEKPKILIMENVDNITNVKFMPSFNEWIQALKDLGYNSSWKKIKAYEYGGGTVRERVFMISTLTELPLFQFPKITGTNKTIKDYLEPVKNDFFIDSTTIIDNSELSYTKSIKLADYKNGGQGNRIYSINGQGVTLTATGGGKAGSSGGLYLRPEGIYKLSPREMCKVMGWDNNKTNMICSVLSNREVGFCLGNAIDLNVMKAIAQEIIKKYN